MNELLAWLCGNRSSCLPLANTSTHFPFVTYSVGESCTLKECYWRICQPIQWVIGFQLQTTGRADRLLKVYQTGVGRFPPGQFPLPFWIGHFPPDNSPHILCIHTYTCMHTHIYIHTHIHIHTYIHTHIHIHTYIHIHAYIYLHTYIYIYMYVCEYTMYVCMYVYLYNISMPKYVNIYDCI